MRLALLLCLPLAPYACSAAAAPDLRKEDLQAIQRDMKKSDASLDWFRVLAKKPVDATWSVMLVQAAPTELRPGAPIPTPVYRQMRTGVFVVSGSANQVRLVLDTILPGSTDATPTLDRPDAHSTCLHFYSDYGMYHGSIKYIYDLSSATPPRKFRYGILALTSSLRQNGKLRYTASFGHAGQVLKGWTERHAIITIEPGAGNSLPAYKIGDAPAPRDADTQPAPLRTANGESVVVANKTPPGQLHQASGIYVIAKTGGKQFFPAPIPTMALHRKIVPQKQAPAEIENDIGPFVLAGAKLWFANTFYDSEGMSGVGAIGVFDIPARRYEMRYLPEIAPWSGSAILLDGDDLWIGLMRRPEGATYGAGLLRYGTTTGTVNKYNVPDLIHTIDRLGDTLYCGTSHGLYSLRADVVTQLRFEPDAEGKLTMVARAVP